MISADIRSLHSLFDIDSHYHYNPFEFSSQVFPTNKKASWIQLADVIEKAPFSKFLFY